MTPAARAIVVLGRPEWAPTSSPDGVNLLAWGEEIDSAPACVDSIRAARLAGAERCLLVVPGLVDVSANHAARTEAAPLVVVDHINLTGTNPLSGPNLDALGVRFPDMTDPYPLRSLVEEIGEPAVAADVPGPLSPSDLQAALRLGAQAVVSGLSAAVIAGNHCGLEMGAIVVPPEADGARMSARVLELIGSQ